MNEESRRQAKRDCKFSIRHRNWRAHVAASLTEARQARHYAMSGLGYCEIYLRACRIALAAAWVTRIGSTQRQKAPLP